eukprot:jgi/Tetstr1/432220/TSEL_021676.t1
MDRRSVTSSAAPWCAAAWALLFLASAACYREIPAGSSFTTHARSMLRENGGGETVEVEESLFQLVSNLPVATAVTPIFSNKTEAELFSKPVVLNPDQGTQARVINGLPLPDVNRFPYVVRLESRPDSEGKISLCGGTLISSSVILTAGHCKDIIHAYIQSSGGLYEKHSIIEAVTHDLYAILEERQFATTYDFHLLRLKDSTQKQPVELDDGSLAKVLDRKRRVLTILGRGHTRCDHYNARHDVEHTCTWSRVVEDVRYAYVVNKIKSDKCFPRYEVINPITRSMISAEDFIEDNHRVDACGGDSGGPMIAHEDGLTRQEPWGSAAKDRQVGVVSFGFGCARKGQSGVYGRISLVHDRIMDRLNEGSW